MIQLSLQIGSGGHLSDLSLSALADGQVNVLAPSTHAHLEACPHCQARLADAVLEHALVAEALAALPAPQPAKPPWGWLLSAAVALFAVRGGAVLEQLQSTPRWLGHAGRVGPLALRTLAAEPPWFVGVCAASLAVVLVFALAAWVAPRPHKV